MICVMMALTATATVTIAASSSKQMRQGVSPQDVSRNYTVLGSIDVGTLETSIFFFGQTHYLLENIGCGYGDHYGQWNASFTGKSYARIRELKSGIIVSNVSESIATSDIGISNNPSHFIQKFWLMRFGVTKILNIVLCSSVVAKKTFNSLAQKH